MRMEDILDLYAKTLPEEEVLVCMDESNKQHLQETRKPLPVQPGEPMKYDYEYRRNGVSALFCFFAPHRSWRMVVVDESKSAREWARHMHTLRHEHFPGMKRIHVVLDNLATHHPKHFYKHFDPETARELCETFVFHFTPKHASWLNMAEIEFSALFTQALNKRIPDRQALKKEVAAWQDYRNAHTKTVDWRFTTKDARTKLKKLYPTIEECV